MTKFWGALLLLGRLYFSASAQAQEAPPTPTSAGGTQVAYFDTQGRRLPSEVGADHRTETALRDSVSGVVREYYLPSGKLKSYVPYAHVRRHLRHGSASYYYESGQLRMQATCTAGKYVGDLVTYYPNGTLKRRDHHLPGQPVTGECFGPAGEPVAYYRYEQMPVYPEGAGDTKAIVNAVMLNTRYPKAALRSRIAGVVKIEFVVDKTGLVQNVRPTAETRNAPVAPALAEAYAQLQEAAMQAVRQLKPFMPGKQDGEPVAVSFTVPVTFNIQ